MNGTYLANPDVAYVNYHAVYSICLSAVKPLTVYLGVRTKLTWSTHVVVIFQILLYIKLISITNL